MTRLEYEKLNISEKIKYKIFSASSDIFNSVKSFFVSLPRLIMSALTAIKSAIYYYFSSFINGDFLTKISYVFMGFSNIFRGQIIKGLIYFFIEIIFFTYLFVSGINSIAKLSTLGTELQGRHFDEEKGIYIITQGDNSMLILFFGLLGVMLTVAFLIIYFISIKSAVNSERIVKSGEKLLSFREEIKTYSDANFHKTLLTPPVIGVLAFTALPLIFMILIAFTNFDSTHQPPGNLFTWVGFRNFRTMLLSGDVISKTFWPVLGWTLVWAVFATGLNYILGIILALLINKKEIRFKKVFRTIFVLSIAAPQFVSLLIMRNILDDDGPLNVLLKSMGLIERYIPFLTQPTYARITIIIVNLWIGIPFTMLQTTGILMNIPADLYEAARIDGASPVKMFFRITVPYVLFVTTPYLITQFIGNINNFNVIYLLSGGNPQTLDYYQAGKTDLLVTWLYKLTVNKKDYCYASTIGILVFVISAVLSLAVYHRTGSYKNEEEFS